MLYTGSFSNINGKRYDVEIKSGSSTDPVYITFGGNPCIISSSSEGLFTPIKSRSCSLEIVSTEYYMDLYDPTARGTTVKVFEYEEDTSQYPNHQGKVIFHGFMTPCEYNQQYSNLDTITLEAIDGISTSKDFKWNNDGTYKTFFDILQPIIKRCNYKGTLYVPEVYKKINNNWISINSSVMQELYASSANFVDDNDAHDPWTEYEVVEEILKFLGWSLCPDGDDVWLIDYREVGDEGGWYKTYNIQTGDFIDDVEIRTHLDVSDYEAGGTPNISIDDIYNKIEISDNLYKIEDISPDIDEEENHISITREKNLGVDGGQWTKRTTKDNFWRTTVTTEITGYDYQTVCRLKPESGWKHRYYRTSNLVELPNNDGMGYYDSELGNNYNVGKINKYCNTHGCLFQHYAHLKEEGKNRLPSSLDWTSVLTFFVMNDKTPNFNLIHVDKFELPVLEYTISETINWKPASGISWITIKGDLYYQYNAAKYGDKNQNTVNIINEGARYYSTLPVDKSVSVDEIKYLSLYRQEQYNGSHNPYYGLGFSLWKMKLQIGDKYWNGTNWTSTESTFYINYNNNPSDKGDEFVSAYKWMSPVNSNDFKDKVGVDGYCIPIDSTKSSDPSFGTLKLTIYTPSLCPVEILDLFKQMFADSYVDVNWKNLPPVIYAKDFELGYVYTNTDVWYNSVDDDDKDDKVYIGLIDDNYVQDFDGLEFKLNTSLPEKPISRSYVSTSNGYLKTLSHVNNYYQNKTQEYNIIDMYLDHYSDRKVIYQCNLHGLFTPSTSFEYSHINGVFVIDSQSYDVARDNNTIKIIAY